ncbi:MAG TPA: hypothetical protein VMM35_01085 [Longimicrobiales bacterium]|nr:hypothetical protein [Longimicrobiales bacterium]
MSVSLPRRILPAGAGLLGLGVVLAAATPLDAQRIPFEKRVFNEQVLRDHSQPVVPIFEGWYENGDGTRDICFGYFNLNLEESLDIPLGEANFIEPSGYDGRQPTHFTPVPGMTPASPFTSRFRRVWCAFTLTVPADFGADDQIWWTLQRPGESPVRTPGNVNVAYVLDEPRSDGRGEVAPVLRFAEGGATFQGRRGMTGPARTVGVGQPLELTIHTEHPFEERLWVGWLKYSGPGGVRFTPTEQRVELEDGRAAATTRATFDAPGEYRLLVQSINGTPAFEFHCCWTNGYVPVTVTGGGR